MDERVIAGLSVEVEVLHSFVFYEIRSNQIGSNSNIFKVIQKTMAQVKENEKKQNVFR